MDTNNEAEKLNIIPEKIIQILLKHLMILKNENAYLKNKLDINSYSEGFPKNKVGINSRSEPIPENRDGIKSSSTDIPKNGNREKTSSTGIPENRVGVKTSSEAIPENKVGINSSSIYIPEIGNSIQSFLKALAALQNWDNSENIPYHIFEDKLITALEEYLKTGDRQQSLYTFYLDFLKAIEERNSNAEKNRASVIAPRIEDTHTLPSKITIDKATLKRLEAALHGYLPRTAMHDLYTNVAKELLCLHNNGKATGNELRTIAGLSTGGFAKHLPKLKRMGLIKKLPPGNYILTETSTQLLLKTFGVLKGE